VNNNNSWDLDAMLSQEIQDLNRDSPEDRRVKEAVIVSKPDPNQINPEDDSDEENRPSNSNYYYYDDDDEYEDDLAIRDPELYKITESNRQIDIDNNVSPSPSQNTPLKHKLTRRPPELVFSDPPTLVSREDYIEVSFYYGLSEERKNTRSKKYMMMSDFGEEGMYALKWGIGTLLRSGDELHVASVVDADEEVEDMNAEEKYKLWAEVNLKIRE
jgi:hypothetical protein